MAGDAPAPCFHCGLPVPDDCARHVQVDGIERPVCCPGCAAVTRAIVDAGLGAFYQHRNALPRPPEKATAAAEHAVYDRPGILDEVARTGSDGIREAALYLEGIVCAACVWLNERHVSALDGVHELRVNLSNHRAMVRWDPDRIQLSDILAAIDAIGYRAHPYDERRTALIRRGERRRALRHLAVAWLGMMQIMMIAVALWLGADADMGEGMTVFLRWVALMIASPVVLYSGQSFYRNAWRDLGHGRIGMDVPVSLAILSTYVAGVWAVVSGHGEIYLESITMFVAFLLTGRFLELAARQRTGETGEALARLQPNLATRIDPDGESVVAAAALRSGDVVRIRPGERVPADGVVIEGQGAVDESLVTGESAPRAKAPGAMLMGGTVNSESTLSMRVTGVGADSTLSAIERLLARAQSEKPPWVLRAERGSGVFTALVLLLAAGAGGAWLWLDPARALAVVVAILVASCPCALALATPMAMTVATGTLARRGVLVTRGHALERLSEVDTVVLDKTGTLTEGRPALGGLQVTGQESETRCLALAAALAEHSGHPLSRALVAAAGDCRYGVEARAVRLVTGGGIEGEVGGVTLRLGRVEFAVARTGRAALDRLLAHDPAASVVALADATRVLAVFRFHDRPRAQAGSLISGLRRMGLSVSVLSGDSTAAVNRIARPLGITEARGDLMPADKLDVLADLHRAGRHVLMVGDGVNDAPVLAAAPVSAAMAGGTELARASADMLLYDDRLDRLLEAFAMARSARRVIRQNVLWALGYNALILPVAAAGLLTPWMAALGMSLSSLLVVVNALRLRLVPEEEPAPAVGQEVLS